MGGQLLLRTAAFLAALGLAGMVVLVLVASGVGELVAIVAGWSVFFVVGAALQRRAGPPSLTATGLRAAVAAAVVAAVGLGAAGDDRSMETAAYGEARLGSLRVLGGVRVTSREADLRGGWLDAAVPCTTQRRLRLSVVVDGPAGTAHRRVTRTGTFLAPNCGESGPSVGFTLAARRLGLACADGSWKPGRYSFLTTTTEPTRRLQASASLVRTVSDRC